MWMANASVTETWTIASGNRSMTVSLVKSETMTFVCATNITAGLKTSNVQARVKDASTLVWTAQL